MTKRLAKADPKVLLVMTAPFNEGGSSRTLDSYFHNWDKECVAQVYSKNCEPTRGHCISFYQITDERLVRRWFNRQVEAGKVFDDEKLKSTDRLTDEYSGVASKLAYSAGRMHTPTIELLRAVLWRKKMWCSEAYLKWLDEFSPDCVLYNYSNHLFTQEIALHASQRFNVPIIPIIGDDYYFNQKRSISPTYHLFRARFKMLTERVMSASYNAIYCSKKCKEKYGGYFNLGGNEIYISSQLERREFRPIDTQSPCFLYCGGVRLGRGNALIEIADALCSINKKYRLCVCTGETDGKITDPLKSHPSIDFVGSVGYKKLTNLIRESDVYVVAEGLREKDLLYTRYSLSTKAADGLASGVPVLAYGPSEAGVIEYLSQTGAAAVCNRKEDLISAIKNLIGNISFQREIYSKAIVAYETNHTLKRSTEVFSTIVQDAISRNAERVR